MRGKRTYIHERRKGEGEDSFDCEGWKDAEEHEKGKLQPGICQVRFLFYFFIFWYSHLHSTLNSLAVFEKLFLLIGVDIEGHLFTLLNRNFLQACFVMIVFLISRFFLQIAEIEIYG